MQEVIPRFKAENKNGMIYFENPEVVRQYTKTLPKEIAVVISDFNTPQVRSNPQNRYYRGVVIPLISDYTGYSREECHMICRVKFLMEEHLIQLTSGQEEIKIPKSTTELTSTQFEDFCRKIREWASKELSIYIPQPNEVNY